MSLTFKLDSIKQSPEKAAEAFDNYFLGITENLNIHIAKDNNPILLLNKYYPPEFPPMHAYSSYYRWGDKYNQFL